jgi:hypothetical protein
MPIGWPAFLGNVYGCGYALAGPIEVRIGMPFTALIVSADQLHRMELLLASHPDHRAATELLLSFDRPAFPAQQKRVRSWT